MIIFYNKKTGEIFGTVDGRDHPEEVKKSAWIQPSGVPKKDVGKFIVPTKPKKVLIEVPVKELRVTQDLKVVEVEVGKKTVEKITELEYNVPFKEKLLRNEDPRDSFSVIKCKFLLNEKGEILDLI